MSVGWPGRAGTMATYGELFQTELVESAAAVELARVGRAVAVCQRKNGGKMPARARESGSRLMLYGLVHRLVRESGSGKRPGTPRHVHINGSEWQTGATPPPREAARPCAAKASRVRWGEEPSPSNSAKLKGSVSSRNMTRYIGTFVRLDSEQSGKGREWKNAFWQDRARGGAAPAS